VAGARVDLMRSGP